ncbi:MAG: hypothetical protein C0618_06375 [Desulfuromonas sp.]|nr:MAG: hypothetical protein C0618_06375 [Desulfuromonas sp.]
MMIRIMYPNGGYDMVHNNVLDRLVTNHQIKKFKRATGWVDIDDDRVRLRRAISPPWNGQDRRQVRS